MPLYLDNYSLRRIALAIKADGLDPALMTPEALLFNCYDILRERPDLLEKLIATLDADIIVKSYKIKLGLCYFWQRDRKRRLREALAQATDARDKFWTDYEIYRRFIDYDNKSLIVAKS